MLEAAESCDSILWEGAPKERRALASFRMNFLLCVISIRRGSQSGTICDTYNTPSTFFVITDCLWGRLIREEIEKLLLVLDDFLLSGWRWVAKAGRAPCGLELEGARGVHWLDLSLFKGSFGAWVGASSMPLADDRAERKALLCNQWCIYLFIFMKGYEFAYILIPAHRTDRYKRNDLEIRE